MSTPIELFGALFCCILGIFPKCRNPMHFQQTINDVRTLGRRDWITKVNFPELWIVFNHPAKRMCIWSIRLKRKLKLQVYQHIGSYWHILLMYRSIPHLSKTQLFNFWVIHKMVPQKSSLFYFKGVWRGEILHLFDADTWLPSVTL